MEFLRSAVHGLLENLRRSALSRPPRELRSAIGGAEDRVVSSPMGAQNRGLATRQDDRKLCGPRGRPGVSCGHWPLYGPCGDLRATQLTPLRSEVHTPDGSGSGLSPQMDTFLAMNSTWESRDLPVLAAVVAICDEDDWGEAQPAQIAERTGLPIEDVIKALWKLAGENPPFFSFSEDSTFGGRDIGSISMPTGHAQRTVGAWPTPESVVEQMILALREAAENADSAEERSRLQRAADAVGGVGRGVITGVMTHVLTQGL